MAAPRLLQSSRRTVRSVSFAGWRSGASLATTHGNAATATSFAKAQHFGPQTTTTTATRTRASLFADSSTTLSDPHNEYRPMTARQRIARFPTAVHLLYRHCQRSDDIHQASRTRRNAWSRNPPWRRRRLLQETANQARHAAPVHPYPNDDNENDPRPGRIPRRQYQQQLQIRQDLGVVLPVVALWMAPLIGYVPMLLAIVAPRQVLTRQFYNAYEIQHYVQLEGHQRRAEFAAVRASFWSMASVTQQPPEERVVPCLDDDYDDDAPSDATGPLVDARPLVAIFAHSGFPTNTLAAASPWRHGVLNSIEALPRDYLVRLALMMGIGQTLPPPLNTLWTASLLPTSWLRARLRHVAGAIVQDDALLLWEGQDCLACATLTEAEVWDACLARNLPLSSNDIAAMRLSLTNHLRLVAPVQRTSALSPDGLGLLTLHLPLLRDFYKATAR